MFGQISSPFAGCYVLFRFAGRIAEKHLPEHMFDYDYSETALRCQAGLEKFKNVLTIGGWRDTI